MKEIKAEELQKNPFSMIGKEWMLVTAEKDGRVNMMTASWGGVGVMWGKNVAFIVIRPQRFTKGLVDAAETLSLSFLSEEYRDVLNYAGTASGRDEDKVKKSGLTVSHEGDAPYFDQAQTVLFCRKLYRQNLDPAGFYDGGLDQKWYPGKDYHTLYIAEIEKVLVK